MEEYIAGYLEGYRDGRAGRRAPDHPNRDQYNGGYDAGHEDGAFHEKPSYTREDLKRIRRAISDRLSTFAI